jgi:hypothetical protein
VEVVVRETAGGRTHTAYSLAVRLHLASGGLALFVNVGQHFVSSKYLRICAVKETILF